MLTDEQQRAAAAELLHRHWQEGTRLAALPEALRPATCEEGYTIQARLQDFSQAPLYGWKIAATSKAGQAHIAVDGPIAGRLFAERVFDSGAERPLGANHMRVAKPEFAFRMARALPPRAEPYATDAVMEAVGALHLAIEVPDSRYADFTAVGAPQLIADNACAHEFLIGPAVVGNWRSLNLACHEVVGRVGELERVGSGANVLGDPRIALAWLANELSGLRLTLEAGQIVTTGTCVQPLPIAPGDQVTADFGELGQATLKVGA